MAAVETLAHDVGVAPACDALSVPRASFYRHRQRKTAPPSPPRPAPAPVFAQLLDEGRYLCSIRTMYRLLEHSGQVRERRGQLAHPPYRKPELLADLGVANTHSRPHVSDDNPYSESHFRTMKYRPEFPDRFGSMQDGRAFCQRFFPWYNDEHRHSGIGPLTPATLHFGLADQAQLQRQAVLTAAYQHHPESFVRRQPKPFAVPKEVWINKPPTTGQNTQ